MTVACYRQAVAFIRDELDIVVPMPAVEPPPVVAIAAAARGGDAPGLIIGE